MISGLFPWHLGRGSWIMESGLWNTILGRSLVVIYFSILILLVSLMPARMSKEDIALKNHFGKEWDNWAKRVPYSMLPGVY